MISNKQMSWGNELLIVNSEKGYSSLILVIKEGEQTPLVYHKKKDKTIMILQGCVMITLENQTKMLNQGDVFHISAKTLHRFMAVKEDATIIETGTKIESNDTILVEG